MKNKKRLVSVTVAAVLLSTTIAACSSKSEGGNSSPGKDATVASPTKSPRIELSMFMANSGLAHPENVDPSDNPFIKIIEDQANVDLKLEIPPWQEFNTKYSLLLGSGKLPDIVHTNDVPASYKAAREGAFIDLKPYYDKSPIVQKVVTPEMMELAKDPISGKYWRIPMVYNKGAQGAGVWTRYDLVEKYNGGKWPETVEDWVDLLRKIKKAEPDSIPMSSRVSGGNVFAYGGAIFFKLFGAYPYDWRIQQGKVIPNVVLPEFKAAVELMRQLYAEGILDPEFATTDSAKFSNKFYNKNVLFQWNNADQIISEQQSVLASGTDITKKYKFVFAPPLKKYPSVLADPKYATAGLGLPIHYGNGLYIPSSSKDKDRAWKVIEAFASDQLREAIFWGKEGETYTVKDGKRVPTEKLGDKDRRWVLQLALIFGFTDGQDAQNATFEQKIGQPLFKQIKDSVDVLGKEAEKVGITSLPGYTEPDDVSKKGGEIQQAINKFTVEAIMGRITMDQFDAEVKAWEAKYRSFKYDPLQKFIDANKDNLRKLGVKMVDW
jgi:putative aldouronate transport system substrate-binding protein